MDHKYHVPTNDNFNIWYESEDPEFTYINTRSNVPPRWMDYRFIISTAQANTIIKPINMYSDYLIPPPELISTSDNIVRIRYKLHADIYLFDNGEKFYNVDRPWIRQYYQTKSKMKIPSNCFPGTYKFYTPWIIDQNIKVNIEESPNSAFHVYSTSIDFKEISGVLMDRQTLIEPSFVPFNFKKEGGHMEDNELGVIRRGSSMFDMVFSANDIMIERIKDFYANYKVSPIQRR